MHLLVLFQERILRSAAWRSPGTCSTISSQRYDRLRNDYHEFMVAGTSGTIPVIKRYKDNIWTQVKHRVIVFLEVLAVITCVIWDDVPSYCRTHFTMNNNVLRMQFRIHYQSSVVVTMQEWYLNFKVSVDTTHASVPLRTKPFAGTAINTFGSPLCTEPAIKLVLFVVPR